MTKVSKRARPVPSDVDGQLRGVVDNGECVDISWHSCLYDIAVMMPLTNCISLLVSIGKIAVINSLKSALEKQISTRGKEVYAVLSGTRGGESVNNK